VPPVATIVWKYGEPRTPEGSGEVVVIVGCELIVNNRGVVDGTPELYTLTETVPGDARSAALTVAVS
jgi:hypothetical protein